MVPEKNHNIFSEVISVNINICEVCNYVFAAYCFFHLQAATTDDIRAFFSAPTLVNWRNIPSNGRKERLQTVVEEVFFVSFLFIFRLRVFSI